MDYLPYLIIILVGLFTGWHNKTIQTIRRRLALLEVDTSVLMERPHQGDKPNIGSTPRLADACELRVANGTPILVMPNGEILPNQMDLSVDHPFGGGKQLPRVTVSMYVNIEDSMWVDKVGSQSTHTAPSTDDTVAVD
jgi:hypothetical protein